jgi:hypothetical protein
MWEKYGRNRKLWSLCLLFADTVWVVLAGVLFLAQQQGTRSLWPLSAGLVQSGGVLFLLSPIETAAAKWGLALMAVGFLSLALVGMV